MLFVLSSTGKPVIKNILLRCIILCIYSHRFIITKSGPIFFIILKIQNSTFFKWASASDSANKRPSPKYSLNVASWIVFYFLISIWNVEYVNNFQISTLALSLFILLHWRSSENFRDHFFLLCNKHKIKYKIFSGLKRCNS